MTIRSRRRRGYEFVGMLQGQLTAKQFETLFNGLDKLLDGPNETREKVLAIRLMKNTQWTGQWGQASRDLNELTIHEELFEAENREDFENTLFHEIAHFVAYWLFGEKGHGQNWKKTLAAFGFEPERVAPRALRVQTENVLSVEYKCSSCGFTFRRSRRFGSPRVHKKCAGRIIITDHPNSGYIGLWR